MVKAIAKDGASAGRGSRGTDRTCSGCHPITGPSGLIFRSQDRESLSAVVLGRYLLSGSHQPFYISPRLLLNIFLCRRAAWIIYIFF